VSAAGDGEGDVQFLPAFRNRPAVKTHPAGKDKPCLLKADLDVPATGKPRLRVKVSHHPHGDWRLIVRADGKDLLDKVIGSGSVVDEWADLEIDLAAYAGKRVKLELENRANDWSNEWAYWNEIKLVAD